MGRPSNDIGGGTIIVSAPPSIPTPPVAGYSVWCDASQITDVSDGDILAIWPDLSGNGYNLSAPSTEPRGGAYHSAGGSLINGLPVVENAAGRGYYAAEAPVDGNACTIFVVAKTSVDTGTTIMWSLTGTQLAELAFSSGGFEIYQFSESFPGDGTPIAGDTNPHVFTGLLHGAASALRMDGIQELGTIEGYGSAQRFYLGCNLNGGYEWQGSFGEVIIYPTALTLAEIQYVEAYLHHKWLG